MIADLKKQPGAPSVKLFDDPDETKKLWEVREAGLGATAFILLHLILAIGPLSRLVPRALQTDDEAAPVLAALDTIRDRDIALLIEAHAGHTVGKGGQRDLRPRGSSALLGWPGLGVGGGGVGVASQGAGSARSRA